MNGSPTIVAAFAIAMFLMISTSRALSRRTATFSCRSSTAFSWRQTCRGFSVRPASSSVIRRLSSDASSTESNHDDDSFFAPAGVSFESLGVQSKVLLGRLNALGLTRPTAVQAASYCEISSGEGDVTIGAETGSGKTLAYLLPLMDDILKRKEAAASVDEGMVDYDYARAMVLVPNKELVQQVVRMAMALAGGPGSVVYGGNTLVDSSILETNQEEDLAERNIVRLAIMPGGLDEPADFQPFRSSLALGGDAPPVDLVISTPAAVGPLGLKPKNIDMFADIQTLVIDEADMLLDGGYIRPLEDTLLGFRRGDRLQTDLGVKKTQHVFVAATLPDMGLRSVDAYIKRRFPYATRIAVNGMHNARHYGLAQDTIWIEEDGKKERMLALVDMLQTTPAEGGLKGEKVMVFLNSVDDVEAATQALLRAGVNALPYHAKVSLGERTKTLNRFRQYTPDETETQEDTVQVLVCTDLASRGLDVPGVNAVVQLQFAGNVVAHLHRMGRTGRAGKRVGRGIVFFGEKERELVEVVRAAEDMQEGMSLQGSDVLDVMQEDGEPPQPAGSVKAAFSRKRGFTKKRKKLRREQET